MRQRARGDVNTPGGRWGARVGWESRSVARTLRRVVVDKARAEDDDDDDERSSRRERRRERRRPSHRVAVQGGLRREQGARRRRRWAARGTAWARGSPRPGAAGVRPLGVRRRRRAKIAGYRFDLTRESDPAVVDTARPYMRRVQDLTRWGSNAQIESRRRRRLRGAYERCRAFVDE